MLMSGLDTYFLDMSAHALLNMATKGSFRGKKSENLAFLGYFSEGKTEQYDQGELCAFYILECSCLVRIHTFHKLLYMFLQIYFSGYCWWVTSGPLYSSVCYLSWFVCFYDLLNSGVFRTLSNFQDEAFCENSWKSLTIFTQIFILHT